MGGEPCLPAASCAGAPERAGGVVVYGGGGVEAAEGAAIGERWTGWVGTESEGAFESEAEAIAAATQLANDYGVTARLVKGDGSSFVIWSFSTGAGGAVFP